MIPQLVISDDSKKIKSYLKTLVDENSLLFEIRPEEKEYSIREIRNLIKETSVFNRNVRIYLLENFQISSLEAQNAALKILEEPPKNVLFVLTADNEQKLIPTIRSRTKIVYLDKKRSILLNPQVKKALAKFVDEADFESFFSIQVSLDEIIVFFRERLIADKKAPLIIKEAVKLKSLLENNNLNPQLTIDHMLIFIKKQYI